MKKYAAALLSVLLFCGCSNITPNNEKVEASQEKLENMTALYTGLAEANETIDNKLEELADIAQRYAVQFNVDKMSIKIK